MFGQTSKTGQIMTGLLATRPTNCNPSDTFTTTDTYTQYVCGPANVWTALGAFANSAQTYGALIDITQPPYNAFATNLNSGYHPTATCTMSAKTVTLSGYLSGGNLWTANGQGIALPNCSSPSISTPSAPTVVNIASRWSDKFGTGHYVSTTNGSTSRNIKIAAVDIHDGVTAASIGTVITNGPATLGEVFGQHHISYPLGDNEHIHDIHTGPRRQSVY